MARFSLIPRDIKFYDLFEQETSNLVAAAEKLVDLFDNYENVEAKSKGAQGAGTQGRCYYARDNSAGAPKFRDTY